MADSRGELREVIEALAAIPRPSASEGEARAASWIGDRLRSLGCEVTLDEEPAVGDFWRALCVLCAVATWAGLTRRRRRGFVLGALAAAGVADEVALGPYITRRLLGRTRTTVNVVAAAGDRSADRTLVLLAHHDAARSGKVFGQGLQKWIWRRYPRYIETHDTSAPAWFPVIAAPLLAGLGALLGVRPLSRLGAFLGAGGVVIFADMGRHDAVPGANDNLSGVAGLVAVARRLHEEPVSGLRVLLVSCGSEESLQEGVRAFGRRWFPSLPRDRTWFLNLESVGSPELVPLEAEGSLVMRDYDRELTDLVCECAAELGEPLRRGSRSWTSTDGCVPLVAGYPTATLVSVTAWKMIANYHWPTDVPENVDYDTVAQATDVAERVVRRLASEGRRSPAQPPGDAIPQPGR